ncbi:hypothetical protein [Streptomyces sp. TSRI0281]|uniref:hypothetical protein n=1 Tax=Streptomyces sp. TSRI0281 TaxID=1718998 RepID=UPI001A7E0C0C|nr:hypothetical protein [Streptomyces sp. TSRI0281]
MPLATSVVVGVVFLGLMLALCGPIVWLLPVELAEVLAGAIATFLATTLLGVVALVVQRRR